jgi:hypothetical protein
VAAFSKISYLVCQFTFPFLERLYKCYGGEGVTFFAISQNDAQATNKFCKEYGITFTTLIDEKCYRVSNAYGLINVPTIFSSLVAVPWKSIAWVSARKIWGRLRWNSPAGRKWHRQLFSGRIRLYSSKNRVEARKTDSSPDLNGLSRISVSPWQRRRSLGPHPDA